MSRLRRCKNESTEVLCRKTKHYMRHENKVNENNILSYCRASRCETIKHSKKCCPLCQTYKPTIIQTRFPKGGPPYRQVVNPRHQASQGQSVEKPGTTLQNILVGNVNMTQRSPKVTCSIQYSRRTSRGENIQGVVHFQNQIYFVTESLTCSSK